MTTDRDELDASWKRFHTYHEVNGLRPTLERWRRWLAEEHAREVRARRDRTRDELRVERVQFAGYVVLLVILLIGLGLASTGPWCCGGAP